MRDHRVRKYSGAIHIVALVMLGLGADIRAQTQSHAPDQRIKVPQSTAERLSKLLQAVDQPSAALNTDTERLLLDVLPESNRKLCGDLVEAWGPQRSEAVASARLLRAHREGDKLSVLLAYRCAFRPNPHFDAAFDERPALLVVSGTGTWLTLIAPYRPQDCCDPQSVEFRKALPLATGQLLELGIQSLSHGDGPDSSSRYELVWIADPAGHMALKVDSRTEYDGYDADTEESHESICDAKVRYENDATGKLTAIVSETVCTEDKVQKPSETVQYVWDGSTETFRQNTSPSRRRVSAP
jgi:hypothetical protein